ncbi:MAG TPA: universal stress protein [Pyrinomonadaceae bacterium]|nr:universal stress protein [Pyrinomonadaceae bacterium]
MRILIGYDGSAYADAALDDLRRAGLPRVAEALIVSVGDGLVDTSSPLAEIAGATLTSCRVTSAIALAREQAMRLLDEARGFAAEARRRVLSDYPGWDVRTQVREGSPSQELLLNAHEWQADLVVVGSRGRSALGRLFLGSVSKTLALKAHCSIRVARRAMGKIKTTAGRRIIVGVDGSHGAARAVRAVRTRTWPEESEVCLIAVDDGTRLDDIPPQSETPVTGGDEGATVNASLMAEEAREALLAEGLSASVEIIEGDPRRVLVEQARKRRADCVFVGARGVGGDIEDTGLGSVSTRLVTGAHCSVEVVR